MKFLMALMSFIYLVHHTSKLITFSYFQNIIFHT